MKSNLKNTFPHVQKFWNDNTSMEDYSPYSNFVVKCKCKNGHEWNEQINRLIRRDFCPICYRFDMSLYKNCPEKLKYWDYEKNTKDPREVSAKSSNKAWWKCENGHSWEAVIRTKIICQKCISVGFKYPELIEKNKPVNFDPFSVRFDSNVKLKWICECGNKRDATVSSMLKGCSCNKNLLACFPEIAKELLNIDPITISPKSNKKCKWQCKQGHIWKSTVANRTYGGNGCPYCCGSIPSKTYNLAVIFPEIAKEWHKKNKKPPYEYTPFSNHKVWWKCKNGHSFDQIIQKRTARGYGCPFCSGRKVCKSNSFGHLYPELAKDWWNNKKTPYDYVPGSSKKQNWKCKKGHIEYKSIAGRVKSGGCLYCKKIKASKEHNFKVLFPEKCKKWNYNKNNLGPENYLPGSHAIVWWICYEHNEPYEWRTAIKEVARGSDCPLCAKSHISNAGTIWLEKLNIKDREIYINYKNTKYYVDGKKGNTIYEYIGLFWHGSPKRFNPDKIHPINKSKFIDLLYKTIIRFNRLLKLGYEIIYKWEDEKEKKYYKISKKKIDILKTARYIYRCNLDVDILQELGDKK